MMTCHPPIRPAATYTVPRTQLLAASHRHVAASYWTAASNVAPTSARSTPSVNDGQRLRPPTVNEGQRRRPPVNGGGSRRPPVNGVNGDGQWWPTTINSGRPSWTTIGPLPDHYRTVCQRSGLVGSTVGSGCHMAPPEYATWLEDNNPHAKHQHESKPGPLEQRLKRSPKCQLS
nr:hypothetical protein [Tanacetum cinerariifolium]